MRPQTGVMGDTRRQRIAGGLPACDPLDLVTAVAAACEFRLLFSPHPIELAGHELYGVAVVVELLLANARSAAMIEIVGREKCDFLRQSAGSRAS